MQEEVIDEKVDEADKSVVEKADNMTGDTDDKLLEMIESQPKNNNLQKSIESNETNILELIGDEESFILKEENDKDKNPETEPYYNGRFTGFNLLVVILYLGAYMYDEKLRDANVTVDIFNKKTRSRTKKERFRLQDCPQLWRNYRRTYNKH